MSYVHQTSNAEGMLANIEKSLKPSSLTESESEELVDAYCGSICSDQGDGVPIQIRSSLLHMSREKGVEHFWYTHFSSGGDPNFKSSDEEPFKPQTYQALADLAAAYYGWDDTFPSDHRPWVASATSWTRYWLMRNKLEEYVTIDKETSAVYINPWEDEIIKRQLPNEIYPEADLHGMTFYVPDASKATLSIGNKKLTNFMRNPADECGQESITIVDFHTPTKLKAKEDIANFKSGKNGTFNIDITPQNMYVLNAPYLMLELNEPNSLVDLTIDIFSEGGRIRFSDCKGNQCENYSGYVAPMNLKTRHGNSHIVSLLTGKLMGLREKCTNEEDWSGCDVISGKISKIILSGKTRTSESSLGITDLKFLRPNSLKIAQGDKLVIGGSLHKYTNIYGSKVVVQNTLDKVQLSYKIEGEPIFLFTGISPEIPYSLTLETADGRVCKPANQQHFLFERSNLDINFDLSKDCTEAPKRRSLAVKDREDFLKWLKL